MKKRKDGRFTQRITLSNGKKVDIYATSKNELKDKTDDIKLAFNMGAAVFDNTTVANWTTRWWKLTQDSSEKTHATLKLYASVINLYILPHIGGMKLKDVKLINCQGIINSMKGKSQSLQHKTLIMMKSIFEYACQNDLLVKNPAQYVKLTAQKPEKRLALTPVQVTELLEACKGTRSELFFHIALYCGLRRGEIAALTWSDIDMQAQILSVNKAVEFIHNQPHTKTPKTEAGYRDIPIPEHLLLMLKNTVKTSIFVTPSAQNKQLTEIAIKHLTLPIFKKLSYKIVFHQLRHTYSTMLYKLGVDAKIHQYLMGHADLKTSLDIYTDLQADQLNKIPTQIEEIYSISKG